MTLEEKFLETLYGGLVLDNEFIFEFIDNYLKKNNINDYVKKVEFLTNNDIFLKNKIKSYAAYASNQHIYIDYDLLIAYAIIDLKINPDDVQSKELINLNLYILRKIYHELTHVEQAQIINTKNNELSYLLKNCKDYIYNIDYDLYIKNHDLFLTEWNANINSSIQTYKFFSEVYKLATNNDYNKKDKYYNLYLEDGYKKNSPLEKYNKFTNQSIKPIDLELIDKIKYGMPLNESEKILSKNINQIIK